jgi:chromate transporter
MSLCPQRLGDRCPQWICGDTAVKQTRDEGGIIDILLAKDSEGRFAPTLARSLKVLATWG